MLHEERTVILAPANVKDKGVKKKLTTGHFLVKQKEVSIPIHQATVHCLQVNSNQNTQSLPLNSSFHLKMDSVMLLKLFRTMWLWSAPLIKSTSLNKKEKKK